MDEDTKRLLVLLFIGIVPALWVMLSTGIFFQAGLVYTVMGGISLIFYTRRI